MHVVHFQRKPRATGNYSVENIYENVRKELKDRVEIKKIECKYESNGIFKRLYNTISAATKQANVNHITGDVNYLNLFFHKNKNIVTILDCGLLEERKGFKFKFYKFLWFTLPIKRAKYIVAISQATKDELLKYVKCDPDKIKVIYVPISSIFNRADKEFDKNKPVILHIGTAPNKNLSRLIKALPGLTCKLVIIGKLSNDDLNNLAENKIEYDNFVNITDEEVFKQYKICDMLAFVSTYEGFGMPIVEANTVGRPVITSNVYSMPEVADNASLLVNPYNIDEIRNGILKIINDHNYRINLVDKGYKNINRFSKEQIANEYFELYKAIYDDNPIK